MANNNTLTLDRILAGSIPLQSPALPNLKTFCTILQLDDVAAGSSVEVPVVTVAQAVIENPTSYESHADTIDGVGVTQVHFSSQFGVDRPSQNAGLALQMQIASHRMLMSKAIMAKLFALLTAANYGTSVTSSSAAFAVANMETLLTAVPNRTAVCLDSAYFAKVKSTWMPPLTESTLAENSVWTGAEANTVGFVARPEAIALPVGYPKPGTSTNELRVQMIPLSIGVDAQLTTWMQRSGRALCASLDIVIAPAIGQSAALRLIKSA